MRETSVHDGTDLCVYWIMVIGLVLGGHGLRSLDYFFIMFVLLVDECLRILDCLV